MVTNLGDLGKRFDAFLYRDLMYVLGGSSVLFALAFVFEKVPQSVPAVQVQVYVALVSYTVGFTVQEVFTILGVIKTRPSKPTKLGWLLKLFEKTDDLQQFEGVEVANRDKLVRCLYLHTESTLHQRLERIINLKQLGTAVGPSFFLTGVILLIPLLTNGNQLASTTLHAILIVGTLLLSTTLILQSWIKNHQQYRRELQLHLSCPECEGEYLERLD